MDSCVDKGKMLLFVVNASQYSINLNTENDAKLVMASMYSFFCVSYVGIKSCDDAKIIFENAIRI
jgi:hypothetical protein